MVCLTYIPNPLKPNDDHIVETFDNGVKLVDILPHDDTTYAVTINGRGVDSTDVVLRDGDQVIYTPVLAKHAIGDIFGLVAMGLIAWYAGPAAGAIAGAIGVTSEVGISLIQAGLVIAGSMLVNAILAPQLPQLGAVSSDSYDTSPTYGWQPINATAQAGRPIPVLYGRMRIGGNVYYYNSYHAANNDEYLQIGVVLCEGEIFTINAADVEINGLDADDISDVYVDYRAGTSDQGPFGKIKTDAVFNNPAATLEYAYSAEHEMGTEITHDTPVTFTTASDDIDSISLVISAPYGLFYANDNGGLDERSVEFKIEYKKSTDSTWTTLQETRADISGYEYLYGCGYDIFDTDYVWSTTTPSQPCQYGAWQRTGKKRATYSTQTFDTFKITAAAISPQYKEVAWNVERGTTYDIRITKLTDDINTSRERNDIRIDKYREHNHDRLSHPNIAKLRVVAKATNNLNGTISSLSAIVSRKYIDVYNDDGIFYGSMSPVNPAWVMWDLITNKRYGAGVDYSMIDFDRFIEFADWCDQIVEFTRNGETKKTRRAQFNGVIDFSTDLWTILQKVASVGRAVPILRGTKYSILIDKPATPVQIFSMGNIVAGSYKTTYLGNTDAAKIVEIKFRNSEIKYQNDFIQYSENPDSYDKTTIEMLGVTNPDLAYRLARYLYWSSKYQRRIIEFDADVEAIACEVGDVIYFAHDVPAWGDSGRVKTGCTTTHIEIDEPVYLDYSKTYKFLIRFSDDTIEERQIATPSSSGWYTSFDLTSALSQTPEEFDVYTLGEVGKEYILLRVTSITRSSEQRRHIVAIDYNETILDDDDYVLPENRPAQNLFPHVTNCTISEHLEKRNDGTIVSYIDLKWETASQADALCSIYYKYGDGDPVKLVENWRGRDYSFEAIRFEEGKTYTFILQASDLVRSERLSDAYTVDHTFVGKSAPPADVTSLTVNVDPLHGIDLQWLPVDDIDLAGYNVYENGSLLVSRVSTNSYHVGFRNHDSTFSVRAVDTSGNESTHAATVQFGFTGVDAPTLTGYIDDTVLRLEWNEPSSTWKIDHYFVEYNGTRIRVDTRAWQIPVTWSSETFSVYAVDVAGNESSKTYYTSTITPPHVYGFFIEVIDNNVLFKWQQTPGDLPIAYAVIKRGDDYSTAEIIGRKKGTFTSYFEKQQGEYTYHVEIIDTAGNVGNHVSKTAFVNQPADYVLNADWFSDFDGTKTNIHVYDDKMLLPVDSSETWEQHWQNNNWDCPQDQIDAGYPLYIEPFENSATYEETFDYGAVIYGSKITVTIAENVVTGSIATSCDIAVSSDGSSWTTHNDTWQVYETNFRYVKITLHFTGDSYDGEEVIQLEVKLDSKLKNDCGTDYANASDTGGTRVDLHVDFVDVDAIIVTPKSTSPITAVVDFDDVPNPTHFYVYLFDDNGNRASGDFYWQARGY